MHSMQTSLSLFYLETNQSGGFYQNSPSRCKVAEHVTIPAEFVAIHEYSPSCAGRTLEISNRQVSSK